MADHADNVIYSAITEGDLSFVVYDFLDTGVATSGSYHTAGEWTSGPTFEANGGGTADDRTKFTDTGAAFAPYMVGWLVSVQVEEFSYLEIVEVDEGGTWIRVKGDADALAASGDRYWLFAPPHVDPATGAMRGSYTGGTFDPEYNTSYLWGLYRYIPPMVGFYVDPDGAPSLGVYGAQSGANKAGNYHAGARTYDPSTGRWTTPDPFIQFANILCYVSERPFSDSDPTGLEISKEVEQKGYNKCRDAYHAALKAYNDSGGKGGKAKVQNIVKVWTECEAAWKRTVERENRKWGEMGESKGNCWRYASDQPVNPQPAGPGVPFDRKLQDGVPNDGGWKGTVDDLIKLLTDSGATKVGKDEKCPVGSWKIAAVVDDTPPTIDFHFYRQNQDGTWTHKRGMTGVSDKDASDKVIKDPETANRDYGGGVNYDKFLGFYCVK
ncbi:MAG: hypothetical protein H6841_02605 [Planctomycetes bacterium]|nr:hypothetical protein [Planctomycetota bacterium]